ncbi:unnamed protein product [Adineta ricciae]|uniref:Ureidoglycolate hydrolase n=1 Tax=Adineta ricciae TaxID=249248 RepID=A0A813RCK5_ADIRI|nr:unnamed protein product [Adineta ricciae]CAF1361983.1 unnamed protein product [Adineta ricciae]
MSPNAVFEIPTCSYKEIEDGYGIIIDTISAKKRGGLTIPFYSNIVEGKNFDFQCRPPVTCRSAEIHVKPHNETLWLERHMHLTQLFIGLGAKESFLMVLGKPTHQRVDLNEEQRALPDLSNVKAFIIPPGCGVILNLGTWHDFPASLGDTVTVLTFNSAEVVEALAAMPAPGEMLGQGDVYKIHLETRLGRKITYNFEITTTATVDEEKRDENFVCM